MCFVCVVENKIIARSLVVMRNGTAREEPNYVVSPAIRLAFKIANDTYTVKLVAQAVICKDGRFCRSGLGLLDCVAISK